MDKIVYHVVTITFCQSWAKNGLKKQVEKTGCLAFLPFSAQRANKIKWGKYKKILQFWQLFHSNKWEVQVILYYLKMIEAKIKLDSFREF